MKSNIIKITAIAMIILLSAFNCSKNSDNQNPTESYFTGNYEQEDQMGRPAINTVFIPIGSKDPFNVFAPINQGPHFDSDILTKLMELNPDYTTNILGLDAIDFSNLIGIDVLNVSLDGTTTFFNGDLATALTGRSLKDDVITTELILIFGGPDGFEKPQLSDDHVDANDKPFLTTFPYLASPF